MDKKPKRLSKLACKTWPTQTYSWTTIPTSIGASHLEITPEITPCSLKRSFNGKGTIRRFLRVGIIKIKIIFNIIPRLLLINIRNILLEISTVLSKKPKPNNLILGNLKILKSTKKSRGNFIKPKNQRKNQNLKGIGKI